MFNQVGPIWAVSETQAFATPKPAITHSSASDKRGPSYAHAAEAVNQDTMLNLNTVTVFQPPAVKVQPKPVVPESVTAFALVKDRCDVALPDDMALEDPKNPQLALAEAVKDNQKSPALAAMVNVVSPKITVAEGQVKPQPVNQPVQSEPVSLAKETQVDQSEKDDFYLDFDALNTLKYEGDSDKALMQVAQKFEALFVQEMFKRMRSATEALGSEDNPLSNNSNNMFQSMLDTQLASSMTKQTSFGLAEMLYQQLSSNQSSYNSQGAV